VAVTPVVEVGPRAAKGWAAIIVPMEATKPHSTLKSTSKPEQIQHRSINNALISITLYQLKPISIGFLIKYLIIMVCMQHPVMHSQYQLVVVVVVVVQSPHRTGSPAFGGDATSREPQNWIDRDDLY